MAVSYQPLTAMEDADFTNYNRVACLLIEIGTKVLRETVTSHIRHDMTLEQALNVKKSRFESLKKRKVISAANFDILYPSNQGSLKERDVDISLWLILARNLCPSRNINWRAAPRSRDLEWQHDVIRIRDIRNDLFHMSTADMTSHTYQLFLNRIQGPLTRLGALQTELDSYLSGDLNIKVIEKCRATIKAQCMEDMLAGKEQSIRRIWIFFGILVILIITIGVIISLVFTILEEKPCAAFASAKSSSAYSKYIS